MTNLQHIRGAIVNPKAGTPTSLFYEFLEDLISSISNIEVSDTLTEFLLLSDSSAEIDNLRQKVNKNLYSLESIAAGETAFTATGNHVVLCNNTATATITLDTTPFDGQQLIVKRRAGEVQFSGTVDGRTDYAVGPQYNCLHLIYADSTGEWSVI